MHSRSFIRIATFFTLVALLVLPFRQASAHCDGMDGPVVKAAQAALDKEDINYILVWIPKQSVEEIQAAFKQSLAVRKIGNRDATDLADRFFFETVVRLHRAGEGAAYSGLKPAGRDLGPAIPAADRAIADGSLDAVDILLTETLRKNLKERYQDVVRTRNYNKDDIDAGRKYVEAYVSYIHFVERLYEDASKPSGGHFHEPESE